MLTAVVCSAATPPKIANKVSEVRFWSLGDTTRISIQVTGGFKYKSERLTNPDRLFFDIEGAKPDMSPKGIHTIPVGDAILKQIRVAETTPGVTRIVLDLEQRVEFTASQLTSPDRLMIELHGTELRGKDKPPPTAISSVPEVTSPAPPPSVKHPILESSTVPVQQATARVKEIAAAPLKPEPRRFEPPPHTASESASVLTPELLSPPPMPAMAKPAKLPAASFSSSLSTMKSALPPPPVSADVAPETKPESKIDLKADKLVAGVAAEPAKRDTNGDRSLTRVLGLKLGRVVIDPGHGGRDVGTHGTTGLLEKDVVLDVARRLGALVQERMGSEVVFTRSDDTYIPLEERTHIANDRKADLFLSIHANSSPIRTVAGVEMYYLNFTTSKAALDTAARENAGSSKSIYDLKDLVEKIALKDKIDESREFATRLETSLTSLETKGNAAAKSRQLKKAPFIVLIGAQMPSVLAEIGFLTNSGDEALLRKPEYRQKIAEALYKGIASYSETLSHFQVAQKHE